MSKRSEEIDELFKKLPDPDFDDGIGVIEFIKKNPGYIVPIWLFPLIVIPIIILPLPHFLKELLILILFFYLTIRLQIQLRKSDLVTEDKMLVFLTAGFGSMITMGIMGLLFYFIKNKILS